MRGSRKFFFQKGTNFFLVDEWIQIPLKWGYHRPAGETPFAFRYRTDDGPTLNAGPPVKIFLRTVPRRCFFCGSFLLVMLLVCVVMSCLFFVALLSPAAKGLTSWLLCVLCFVTFPNVSWSTSEARVRLAP